LFLWISFVYQEYNVSAKYRTIRHISVQNIPEIWRKERLSILLQRKLEIMTLETETMKVLEGMLKNSAEKR